MPRPPEPTFALGDRVVGNVSRAWSAPFASELQAQTLALQRGRGGEHKLRWTGGIHDAPFQCHVYNRVVSALARAREAAGQERTVICETGFNAGHSALLFLLSHPKVEYYGWELGDPLGWEKSGARTQNARLRWASGEAAERLRNAFPGRVNVTFGDSHKTIVPFFRERPGLVCDVVSVDGDHSKKGVLTDLEQLEPHLREGGILLTDDCNQHAEHFATRKMFHAYAEYVTSHRGSGLASALRVNTVGRKSPGFCIATKGGAPRRVVRFLSSVDPTDPEPA